MSKTISGGISEDFLTLKPKVKEEEKEELQKPVSPTSVVSGGVSEEIFQAKPTVPKIDLDKEEEPSGFSFGAVGESIDTFIEEAPEMWDHSIGFLKYVPEYYTEGAGKGTFMSNVKEGVQQVALGYAKGATGLVDLATLTPRAIGENAVKLAKGQWDPKKDIVDEAFYFTRLLNKATPWDINQQQDITGNPFDDMMRISQTGVEFTAGSSAFVKLGAKVKLANQEFKVIDKVFDSKTSGTIFEKAKAGKATLAELRNPKNLRDVLRAERTIGVAAGGTFQLVKDQTDSEMTAFVSALAVPFAPSAMKAAINPDVYKGIGKATFNIGNIASTPVKKLGKLAWDKGIAGPVIMSGLRRTKENLLVNPSKWQSNAPARELRKWILKTPDKSYTVDEEITHLKRARDLIQRALPDTASTRNARDRAAKAQKMINSYPGFEDFQFNTEQVYLGAAKGEKENQALLELIQLEKVTFPRQYEADRLKNKKLFESFIKDHFQEIPENSRDIFKMFVHSELDKLEGLQSALLSSTIGTDDVGVLSASSIIGDMLHMDIHSPTTSQAVDVVKQNVKKTSKEYEQLLVETFEALSSTLDKSLSVEAAPFYDAAKKTYEDLGVFADPTKIPKIYKRIEEGLAKLKTDTTISVEDAARLDEKATVKQQLIDSNAEFRSLSTEKKRIMSELPEKTSRADKAKALKEVEGKIEETKSTIDSLHKQELELTKKGRALKAEADTPVEPPFPTTIEETIEVIRTVNSELRKLRGVMGKEAHDSRESLVVIKRAAENIMDQVADVDPEGIEQWRRANKLWGTFVKDGFQSTKTGELLSLTKDNAPKVTPYQYVKQLWNAEDTHELENYIKTFGDSGKSLQEFMEGVHRRGSFDKAMMDVKPFFTEDVLNKYHHSIPNETTVTMSPREYLDLVDDITEGDLANDELFSSIHSKANNKQIDQEISLTLMNDGTGKAKVVGQDGRKLMLMLSEKGLEDIPVRIKTEGSLADWKEVKGVPTKLEGKKGVVNMIPSSLRDKEGKLISHIDKGTLADEAKELTEEAMDNLYSIVYSDLSNQLYNTISRQGVSKTPAGKLKDVVDVVENWRQSNAYKISLVPGLKDRLGDMKHITEQLIENHAAFTVAEELKNESLFAELLRHVDPVMTMDNIYTDTAKTMKLKRLLDTFENGELPPELSEQFKGLPQAQGIEGNIGLFNSEVVRDLLFDSFISRFVVNKNIEGEALLKVIDDTELSRRNLVTLLGQDRVDYIGALARASVQIKKGGLTFSESLTVDPFISTMSAVGMPMPRVIARLNARGAGYHASIPYLLASSAATVIDKAAATNTALTFRRFYKNPLDLTEIDSIFEDALNNLTAADRAKVDTVVQSPFKSLYELPAKFREEAVSNLHSYFVLLGFEMSKGDIEEALDEAYDLKTTGALLKDTEEDPMFTEDDISFMKNEDKLTEDDETVLRHRGKVIDQSEIEE